MMVGAPTLDRPLAGLDDLAQPPPEGAQARLEVASALVRAWCGWQISFRAADPIEADWDGCGLLHLPSLHLLDVTEVRELTEGAGPAGRRLPASAYSWWRNGLVKLAGTGPPRPRAYIVVADHGWDPVPPIVVAAVASVASEAGGAGGANPAGLAYERLGDYQRGFQSRAGLPAVLSAAAGDIAFPPDVLVALGAYRIERRP